jgi:Polysaccharide lyase
MSRRLRYLPPIAAAVLVGIALTGCSAQATSASNVGTTTAALNATGLSLLRADPMINPDPTYIWGPGDKGEGVEADTWYGGALSAKARDRLSYSATGGPSNGPFRTCTVQEDDLVDSGDRCELGWNTWVHNNDGSTRTFMNYRAGENKLTTIAYRLPTDFPISTNKWQVIGQMKQAGPNATTACCPAIAIEARQNQIQLQQFGTDEPGTVQGPRVAAPPLGQWFTVSIEAYYSKDPTLGWVEMSVNAQTTSRVYMQTLATQGNTTTQSGWGDPPLNPGDPIPSHLRVGLYHDPSLPGSHVDIGDVTVYG